MKSAPTFLYRNKLQALCLATLTAFVVHVNAAPIPWAEQEIKISVKEQKLREVIKGIFDSNLIPVQIDAQIDGVVKDVRFNLKPQQLLDLLSRQYSFSVYFDGQSAFVTPSAANVSRVFKLDRSAQAQARRVLASLNLMDPKFPVRFDESGRIASVTGPARFVNAVEAALSTLEDTGGSAMRGEVRLFPLANGIAADRVVNVGSNDVTISGVASLLRKVYKPQGSGSNQDGGRAARQSQGQARKGGIDPMNAMLRSIGGRDNAADPAAQAEPTTQVSVIESRDSSDLPVIEAIPQINAIAIRDTPERLRQYEEVIKRLDVKQSVVLIEVSIVEVTNGSMDKVGVDWRFGNSRGGATLGGDQSPNSGRAIPVDGRGALDAAGGILNSATGAFAFISGVGRSSLIQAQVYAMISDGSAKVVSTPRIVTMMNEEGLFSNNSTFYARVSGNLEANLFAIEAGTSVRVTPLTTTGEGETRAMRFAVRIEDGRFSERFVDNLPVTQKSVILTSAIIPMGQSLAVAGLSEEVTSSSSRGVPGLSSLPGIGALFRTKSDEKKTLQRVYLITPRVIE